MDLPSDPRPALGLCLPPHTRRIPVHMLYEGGGSALYEAIEQHPDYYLYEEERQLLMRHAAYLVDRIPPGAVLIELGCGDCTKTRILLSELCRRDGQVDFVGIDASADCLSANKARFAGDAGVRFAAIHDNFFGGLRQAAQLFPQRELVVMLLGSTLGNMSFEESCHFVGTVIDLAMHPAGRAAPRLLFGLDMWKDEQRLRRAYDNDLTAEFELGGLRNTLRHIDPACDFREQDWRYVVDINGQRNQVEMYAEAVRAHRIAGIDFEVGERVLIEVSHKFREEEIPRLFAGCEVLGHLGDGYRLYVLRGHRMVDDRSPSGR